jgi:hypothetical protein
MPNLLILNVKGSNNVVVPKKITDNSIPYDEEGIYGFSALS